MSHHNLPAVTHFTRPISMPSESIAAHACSHPHWKDSSSSRTTINRQTQACLHQTITPSLVDNICSRNLRYQIEQPPQLAAMFRSTHPISYTVLLILIPSQKPPSCPRMISYRDPDRGPLGCFHALHGVYKDVIPVPLIGYLATQHDVYPEAVGSQARRS